MYSNCTEETQEGVQLSYKLVSSLIRQKKKIKFKKKKKKKKKKN